jgi:hypothetical protein
MVYSNGYAYDSRRGQNPTIGIYGKNYGYTPYNTGSIKEDYDHNRARSNYTLHVMPYDEDEREDFIDPTQSSCVPIYLLIATAIILFLLYVV